MPWPLGGATIAETLRSVLGPVLLGSVLTSCAVSGGAPASAVLGQAGEGAGSDKRASVKVAMLLPLSASGQTAAVAKGMKQAGEMALFERNNPSFQLIVKDDKGTPEGAQAAAEEAVKEGAELILGPLFAKSVGAVAPVARRANIAVVAFSNDRQVAASGVYLLSFLVRQEVERIVSFALQQGKRRFAALVPDDAYGKLAGAAFRDVVGRGGGEIVAQETYPGEANGMIEPVRRLTDAITGAEAAGAPVDAVFIPGGAEALANLGPVLAYARLDTQRIKLIGTGGWDAPNIGRDGTFIGAWYPAPDPRAWREFSERFAKTFGAPAPRIASLAYDGVGFAIALSGQPPGGRFTVANLTRASGFIGIDGPVRLSADGTAERGFAVLEVQKFGASVVDPAPALAGAGRLSATDQRLN